MSAGPGRRWAARAGATLLVAVAVGLGAVLLRIALDWTTRVLLGSVIDLVPVADGLWRTAQAPIPREQAWAVPLVVAAGMVAAAALSRFAGRPAINGTDGVIAAVNTRDAAGLDLRGAAVKLAGTAITLGSGGSGGTEGPVVQVSASVAGTITRRLRLPGNDRYLLIAAAMGAGVGALFQAPIAGAILAGELLRRRGIDWYVLCFAVPAAPVAFAVFVTVHGRHPMFGPADLGALWDPSGIACLVATGLLCAVVVRLYVWTFHRVGQVLGPARRWREAVAAPAGAVVGTMGIFVPMTLGTGYGSVAEALSDAAVAAVPLWILATLPLVKIAATALTLHAGGIGGVFGPAMVIGATTGALCWRIATEFGIDPGPAALFTTAGLAACLGPSVRAPLASIMLAAEVTGHLLPPVGLVLAVLVASACTPGITLFPSQIDNRIDNQFARRYRQFAVSVMLKRAVATKRGTVRRLRGGVRSRNRSRGRPAGEGAGLVPESDCGIPDLADLPLAELLSDRHEDVRRAYRTAAERRAAVGIVFAGHSRRVM